MSKNQYENADIQDVKEAARKTVEQGSDIRNEVRNLTLKILSQGNLDVEKMSQVVRAVIEGASIGAEAKGTQVKDALLDTMAGMDEALAKSAEASKLAIEEAAGHLKDFSSHDLKRAVDDLLTLEKLFFETIQDVAKGSNEMIRGTLNDLINHAQQSSSSVGITSSNVVTSLNQKLGNTLKDTVSASAHASLETGAHIANTAAGILEGIADSLQTANKGKSDKE